MDVTYKLLLYNLQNIIAQGAVLMDSWNGLDFIIFLIFAVNTIMGMVRGAMKEIISMLCLSAALIIMIKFTVPLAAFFNSSPLITDVVDSSVIRNFMLAIGAGALTPALLQEVFYCISILICFVGTFSLCEGALAYRGFSESLSFPYAALNSKLGAALGCTRAYVVTLIFLAIISLHLFTQGSPTANQFIANSYFARLFQSMTIKLDSLITGQNPEKYREIFEGKDLYNQEQILKQLKSDDSVEKSMEQAR
jgi:hypothetical protein